jgi:hypothetical protein
MWRRKKHQQFGQHLEQRTEDEGFDQLGNDTADGAEKPAGPASGAFEDPDCLDAHDVQQPVGLTQTLPGTDPEALFDRGHRIAPFPGEDCGRRLPSAGLFLL